MGSMSAATIAALVASCCWLAGREVPGRGVSFWPMAARDAWSSWRIASFTLPIACSHSDWPRALPLMTHTRTPMLKVASVSNLFLYINITFTRWFQNCFMFFCTSTHYIEKRQSMMRLFEFPEHTPEKILVCYYAHVRVMTRCEETWRLLNFFFQLSWKKNLQKNNSNNFFFLQTKTTFFGDNFLANKICSACNFFHNNFPEEKFPNNFFFTNENNFFLKNLFSLTKIILSKHFFITVAMSLDVWLLLNFRVNYTRVARAIRQRHDHLNYGDCWSRATQNAIHPFFENSFKCVCFCLIIALFDYHCTQILCEVEEEATCMSMSPSCLSNSGRLCGK